jgi:glycosyltransferase involved in cell wall biosynthesis
MKSPRPGADGEASQLRVLWLIKGLGSGGAEQLLVLSARLRQRDKIRYHVAYLLPWKDALVGALEREGVFASCLRSRGSFDLGWLARLRKILRTEQFDIVHAHSPVAAAGVRIVARTLPTQSRPAVITTEHNVWSSHARLTRYANAATSHFDDATIAVSGAVRDSMPPRRRRATQVVQYGVDIDAVLEAASGGRDSIRAELGIAREDIVVGTVANLRRTKAYPDLLAAARIVIDQVANVRFVAVGQGPQADELRALHSQLGLGPRFHFTGYRPDAVRVMSAFDIFCLASHHEGLPIAMLEALTLGLPIVATDVGGIRDLVADGSNAVLVQPGRPDDLAKAMIGLVTDPDRRTRMSEAAIARRPDFAVDAAVRRVELIYAQTVAR